VKYYKTAPASAWLCQRFQ